MFTIVVFKEENVCEGVPSSWIKQSGEETFCLWPQRDVSRLIRKEAAPSSSWLLVRCQIKSTALDYTTMVQKRREAEKVTTDNKSDTDEDMNKVQYRQTKNIIDSSDDETSPSPPPPPPPKKKQSAYQLDSSKSCAPSTSVQDRQTKNILDSSDDEMLFSPPSPPPPPPPKKKQSTYQLARSTSCAPSTSDAASSDELAMNESILRILEVGFSNLNQQMINIREEIKLMKRTMNKLAGDSHIASSNLPALPIKTKDELEVFEELLKEEEQRAVLVTKLSTIGGAQARSVINNMMNTVMSREIAVEFSLLGRTTKRAFKDLNLCACILEAVKKNPMCKEQHASQVLKVIGNNLINAKDRLLKRRRETLGEEENVEHDD